VPEGAAEPAIELLNDRHLALTVKKPRKTKIGDYRPPRKKGMPHEISVNGDLNPYAFLVTLIHEYAHLKAFERYGQQKIKPHGPEWKMEFQQLLNPFISRDIFPDSIRTALSRYLENPSAATCTDYQLMQALRAFDKTPSGLILLDELPEDAHFIWGENRVFKKAGKLRKRLRCIELKTQRYYLFNPAAEVRPYAPQ